MRLSVCLLSMKPGLKTREEKPRCVLKTHNHSTLEMESGEPEIQSHPELHRVLETSLGYRRLPYI